MYKKKYPHQGWWGWVINHDPKWFKTNDSWWQFYLVGKARLPTRLIFPYIRLKNKWEIIL